jgi:nucleoside-diphosphate kinase
LSNILSQCEFDSESPSQCSLILVTPAAVRRGLTGRILARVEDKGFTLVAASMKTPSASLVEAHYRHLSARPSFPGLVEDMAAGPLFAAVVRGPHAVEQLRALAGPADPRYGSPGQLRFDLGSSADSVLHTSEGPGSARREVELWFA